MRPLKRPDAAALRRRTRRLRLVRPRHIVGLRWAERGLRLARRDLDVVGTKLVIAAPSARERELPPPILEAYLRVRHATCLERTLIVQRLLAAHDVRHDIVIGVRESSGTVSAHAWIEGWDSPRAGAGFREITRVLG